VSIVDPLANISPELREKYEDAIATMMFDPNADRRRQDVLRAEAIEAAEVVLRLATNLDVNDMHGKETPMRFIDMLKELTTPTPIKWKTFPNEGYDEMIIERDIPFTSLCNHHVIPFIGVAHIGYVPDQEVPGLSKLARVVHHFAKALQVQERLTKQIADFLEENLKPRGVAVVLEAEHMCMTIRGVQVPGTRTYTAAMRGVFGDHARTAKMEFMSRLNGGH
jgi:GTP cyclohydrolase I